MEFFCRWESIDQLVGVLIVVDLRKTRHLFSWKWCMWRGSVLENWKENYIGRNWTYEWPFF